MPQEETAPNFPKPPVEDTPEQRPRHSTLKRIGAAAALLAAVGAVAAVTISGVKGKDGGEGSAAPAAKADGPVYAPAELSPSGPNEEVARDNMEDRYLEEGQATGLFAPTPKTRAALHNSFDENSILKTEYIPRLREVVYMQDEELFRPEYTEDKDNLYVYPFSIYNATGYPIDLPFINYAVKNTKNWLNYAEAEGGFIIDGHTRASVEPRAVPHYMTMTRVIPSAIRKDLPKSDGVTHWEDDRTDSFIRPTGPLRNPFEPWIVGTEVCQALIDVDYQGTVSGQEDEQQEMEDVVASFNMDADNNLDLVAQESVCNALGRTLEAAYLGREEELEDSESVYGIETSWLDYTIFESRLPTFIRVGRDIKDGDLKIITASKDTSPTMRYYRNKQAYLAAG